MNSRQDVALPTATGELRFKAVFPLFPFIHEGPTAGHLQELIKHFFEQKRLVRAPYVTGLVDQHLLVQIQPFDDQLKQSLGAGELILEYSNWSLEFSGVSRFPGKESFYLTGPTGEKIDYPEEQLRGIWETDLPKQLDLTFQTYICAVAIACPSIARVVGGFWLVDHGFKEAHRYLKSIVPEAAEFFSKNGIPLDTVFEIDTTIAWVMSQNGVYHGYSDTPASRALGFFTRLFATEYRNDELSDLVWAVAGVEALLVEGGRSSLGQLKVKVSALFRDSEKLQWLLTMLDRTYAYRSKMVHGNRNLRSAFRDDEESESRSQEEYESQLFSVGLLLWLLRYVIGKQSKSIEFRTILA